MESVTQSKTECMEELTSHDFELSRACSHLGDPSFFKQPSFQICSVLRKRAAPEDIPSVDWEHVEVFENGGYVGRYRWE